MRTGESERVLTGKPEGGRGGRGGGENGFQRRAGKLDVDGRGRSEDLWRKRFRLYIYGLPDFIRRLRTREKFGDGGDCDQREPNREIDRGQHVEDLIIEQIAPLKWPSAFRGHKRLSGGRGGIVVVSCGTDFWGDNLEVIFEWNRARREDLNWANDVGFCRSDGECRSRGSLEWNKVILRLE